MAEYTSSFPLECWNLAEGEAKSQSHVPMVGYSNVQLCPPPSLDTQELPIDYFDSMSWMNSFILGEEKSQKTGRDFYHSQISACPHGTLETQEFQTRFQAEDDESSMDSLACSHSVLGEARSHTSQRESLGLYARRRPASTHAIQELAISSMPSEDVPGIRDEGSKSRKQILSSATQFPIFSPESYDVCEAYKRRFKFNKKLDSSPSKSLSPSSKGPRNDKSLEVISASFLSDEEKKQISERGETDVVVTDSNSSLDHAQEPVGVSQTLARESSQPLQPHCLVAGIHGISPKQIFASSKENVDLNQSSLEVCSLVTTTISTDLYIECTNAGDEGPSLPAQVHNSRIASADETHGTRSTKEDGTTSLGDKIADVGQRRLTSCGNFVTYQVKPKRVQPETQQATKDWFCPRASKRPIPRKARQCSLDGWLA